MRLHKIRFWIEDNASTPENFIEWLRSSTLCRLGRHCRPSKRERKFDGGKCPLLCCYCRRIVGTWRPGQ